MMDTPTHPDTAPRGPSDRTIYVEACHGGVNPETMVRVVWEDRSAPEERQIFDTLEEALAYAQSLCESES